MNRLRSFSSARAGVAPLLPVLLFTLLATLLAGCATVAPGPSATREASTSAPRSYAEKIFLDGRLSIRYETNGSEEALHGGFSWAQQPALTTVTLRSPLGQTMAVIRVTPEGAVLQQSGETPRAAADVDALVREALGWPLPISGLQTWLQGFAIDAAGKRFIATPENAEVVTQDGWHIHYASWQDNRPRRIDLERYAPQAGQIRIRIVIDTWQT